MSAMDKLPIEPLFYSLFIKEGTWVRAYVNDLPLYTTKPDGQATSESYTLNELLVPGENKIALEVLKSLDTSLIPEPERRWTVRFQIYRQTDAHDPDKRIEDTPEFEVLQQIQFPDVYDAVEPRFRREPFFYETTFACPFDPFPEPVWKGAPKAEFDDSGVPELRDVVSEFHRAIQERDADAFLDITALKRRHEVRAFDADGYETNQAKAIREWFDLEPAIGDLDFSELHFRALQGGRVAHVTRLDGGYAFDARATKNTERRMLTDLLLTQQSGRWRVFA